ASCSGATLSGTSSTMSTTRCSPLGRRARSTGVSKSGIAMVQLLFDGLEAELACKRRQHSGQGGVLGAAAHPVVQPLKNAARVAQAHEFEQRLDLLARGANGLRWRQRGR